MDFSISKEQEELGRSFEAFCQEKIASRSMQADKESAIPDESWKDLAEMGFFRLPFPEEAGGIGGDWVVQAMAEESLAKACASTFLSAGASIGLCGGPLFHYGSDEQKERWLAPMMAGEKKGCFGLTEPGAGTDVKNMKSRARKTDSGWVLSGEKALITNAPVADVAVVMAVTDPDAGYAGVTAFAVDLSKEGVTRSEAYSKMGLRASTTGGLVFDEVQLDDSDVVGSVGAGFLQAMQTLEFGRIGMCHFGIGIAEAAYEASMKYATEREAFGKPIARLQAVHFKIADMKVKIDAARLMARRVFWTKSQGTECRELASVAKLYATEMAVEVTDAAVQIHGGWGYTDDFVVERLYRDARLGPIGEGTSEIQRELIARSLLD
jgi:alkylation response protein AidB-like acyl-CoA dehydrogenase